MSEASSERQPTVLITGSNRGIGLEYVRQFSERGWKVIATARKPDSAEDLKALAAENDSIIIEQLDVTDFARIDALAEQYRDQPIDVLLSNAGLTPSVNPEQAMGGLDGVDFDMVAKSLEVNAIAVLKLAQAFLPHVAASDQKKIVVMSSKAGSFELSPKWSMMYGYRASKAALNMYMYTLSFEAAQKGVSVTMLSPGTVNTVPKDKIPPGTQMPAGLIEPEESVSKMMVVIDGMGPETNGKFLNYEEGEELAW